MRRPEYWPPKRPPVGEYVPPQVITVIVSSLVGAIEARLHRCQGGRVFRVEKEVLFDCVAQLDAAGEQQNLIAGSELVEAVEDAGAAPGYVPGEDGVAAGARLRRPVVPGHFLTVARHFGDEVGVQAEGVDRRVDTDAGDDQLEGCRAQRRHDRRRHGRRWRRRRRRCAVAVEDVVRLGVEARDGRRLFGRACRCPGDRTDKGRKQGRRDDEAADEQGQSVEPAPAWARRRSVVSSVCVHVAKLSSRL